MGLKSDSNVNNFQSEMSDKGLLSPHLNPN